MVAPTIAYKLSGLEKISHPKEFERKQNVFGFFSAGSGLCVVKKYVLICQGRSSNSGQAGCGGMCGGVVWYRVGPVYILNRTDQSCWVLYF